LELDFTNHSIRLASEKDPYIAFGKHWLGYSTYTVKKLFDIPVPSLPAGMSLNKLSLDGNNNVIYKLFLPRESLISDIPAGDEHIEKLFLLCTLGLKEKFLLFKEVSFPEAQLSYRSNKF
jgi:hypothetical protein